MSQDVAYAECCEHCHAENGQDHHKGCPELLWHIHISESSSDCDGPHEHDRIEPGRLDAYFALCHVPYTFEGDGTFSRTVEYVPEGPGHEEDSLTRLIFSGPTDEGYHSIEFRECSDDCDQGKRSQRDVFAERMGY
jgi:hypothetical protein